MIRILDRALHNHRYLMYLRANSVAVWLFLVLLWSGDGLSEAFSKLPTFLRFLANLSTGIFSLFAISGSIVLWISMIYYWRHFDAQSRVKRGLWFPIILLGFCFGASIYCWLGIKRTVGGEDVETTLPVSEGEAKRSRGLVRLLGILMTASLSVCLVLGLVGYPRHPVISQVILANLVMVFVPTTMIFTLVYLFAAIFSKKAR